VLAGKKNSHALTVADTTEGAAKQHSIKSCYSTDDAVFVPCQKTLHDSPPLDACAKDIMREEIMGRHHLFLVAARTGCVMCFSGSFVSINLALKTRCKHMVTNQTESILGTEKARSHAAVRFSPDQDLTKPDEISKQFRTFLKIEDQRLKMAHRCGAAGKQIAAARSSMLDLVVERAYYAASVNVASDESAHDSSSGFAVVAVGGYGRGELAPHSDLDLLFLHSDEDFPQTRSLVEQITRLLWDAGLTVGHSFRMIADCTAAALADPHFRTALVSTRLLAGDVTLYDSLLKTLERDRRT